MIRLRFIASREQDREKGRTTRCTTRLIYKSPVKDHALYRHAIKMRRGDILRAIDTHVEDTVVIGEEDDDVGLIGRDSNSTKGAEKRKKEMFHGFVSWLVNTSLHDEAHCRLPRRWERGAPG